MITKNDLLYEIKELKLKHSISVNQILYLMALPYNIDWALEDGELVELYGKGLLKASGKEAAIKFYGRKKGNQGTLALKVITEPKGTEETLKLAHSLETKLVKPEARTPEYLKTTADLYFKGDTTTARYYNIFRAMFPVKDLRKSMVWNNINWVSLFCVDYDGMSMWDDSMVVAKTFFDIYRSKDIGLFLSGTFHWVQDCVNVDECTAFVSKPAKYLRSYGQWYELAKNRFEASQANKKKRKSSGKIRKSTNTL